MSRDPRHLWRRARKVATWGLFAATILPWPLAKGSEPLRANPEELPRFIRSPRPERPERTPEWTAVCTDGDGDGYSPDGGACGPVDCDDADPSLSPGAPEVCDGIDNDCDGQIEARLTDDQGHEYCLSVVVEPAHVGVPATATIYGYHELGVSALRFTPPDVPYNTSQWFYCDLEPYCQFTTTAPAQSYAGVYVVGASLDTGAAYRTLTWTSQAMYVSCPGEYCEPDPLYVDFIDWMRERGYSESVVSFYADLRFLYADVDQFEVPLHVFRDNLRERGSGFVQPFALTFHDIVPTDTEATYLPMGEGEGLPCEPLSPFPDWCNPVVSADYRFVERHFESVFGMAFDFQYLRTEIDYSDVLGDPELRGTQYLFRLPFQFNNQYRFPDIVHCALTTWKGLPIDPIATAQFAAWCGVSPHTASRMVVFSHEWGHTVGLSHPFYRTDTGRVFWRLEGIMDNTYRFGLPPAVDVLDPLERYVVEPEGGFLDQATFASEYSDLVIGSLQMKRCKMVELNLAGASVVQETPSHITYRVALENAGNTSASFVRLAVLDGDSTGMLVAERIVDRLPPRDTILHDFTLSRSLLSTGRATFVLDRDNRVQELSEFPESGCPHPPLCADADSDGLQARVGDVVYILNYVFKSGPEPFPLWTADFQATSPGVTVSDIIYLINHIFKGGPAPVCSAGS